MRNKPVKVLHMVGAMNPGGMENFIMNMYEHIDRGRLQFDFSVHMRKETDYGDKIESMGGCIYELPRLTRKPLRSLLELKKIITKNKYDIVIRHTPNALIAPQLMVAKKCGAITICHSHNTTDPMILLHKIGKIMLRKCADVRIACSNQAGKWMFDDQDYIVVNNAIDIQKFEYLKEKADRVIEEFDLQGKNIYGHIANFIESKNHKYLLEVFKEITDLDENAVLICLGDGNLRQEIEQRIKELGLERKVILAGMRHDAFEFMSAFDIMLFPSLFEGLPLTLIEAQAAGLPILMSDTVTEDVIVTEGLVEKMSISQPAKVWAERATEICRNKKGKDRTCQRTNIAEHGYDVEALAKWYENYLIGLADK